MAMARYGLLTIADGEAESGQRPGDETLAERLANTEGLRYNLFPELPLAPSP